MNEITLWIPAPDQPCWEVIIPLFNSNLPNDTRLNLYRGGANNPKYSWNQAVKDFLKTENEWLWSVHNDVVVAPETLNRLLSWGKPLVSALIFMRVAPVVPHIWKSYEGSGRMVMRINDTRDWFYAHPEYIRPGAFVMEPRPDDALAEIDFTSTSCTLIHRSVLEDMRPLVGDQWFVMDDDINGGGEDRRFFQYALQAGYPAFVDRSAVVGHLPRTVPTSSIDFIAWDSASTFMETGQPETV